MIQRIPRQQLLIVFLLTMSLIFNLVNTHLLSKNSKIEKMKMVCWSQEPIFNTSSTIKKTLHLTDCFLISENKCPTTIVAKPTTDSKMTTSNTLLLIQISELLVEFERGMKVFSIGSLQNSIVKKSKFKPMAQWPCLQDSPKTAISNSSLPTISEPNMHSV